MKKIENFGAFLTERWDLALILVVMLATWGWILSLPKSVTLDAKHWECTVAVPKGIETMCTVYNYRGK